MTDFTFKKIVILTSLEKLKYQVILGPCVFLVCRDHQFYIGHIFYWYPVIYLSVKPYRHLGRLLSPFSSVTDISPNLTEILLTYISGHRAYL